MCKETEEIVLWKAAAQLARVTSLNKHEVKPLFDKLRSAIEAGRVTEDLETYLGVLIKGGHRTYKVWGRHAAYR